MAKKRTAKKAKPRKKAPSHSQAKQAAKKLGRYGAHHAKRGAKAAVKHTKSAAKKVSAWFSSMITKAKKK